MLESKIWEEVEQKSKVFLRQVMGEETFDEFIKNGKIQIKSGNITYELYDNGNVINITNDQKYCLVPDRSDYPIYDIIAIKFAWLKYGQKTVERVANRTNLDIVRPNIDGNQIQQGNTASYAEFVHYMASQGWTRNQITINECNTNLVVINSVEKQNTDTVINIRCPAGCIITMMGINQVLIYEGIDIRSAYSFVLRISDENDMEISGNTAITIDKIRPSRSFSMIARGPYSLFSLTRQIGNETFGIRAYKTHDELYRWRSGIHLMSEDMLRVTIVNSPIDINRKYVKMCMDIDLWVM